MSSGDSSVRAPLATAGPSARPLPRQRRRKGGLGWLSLAVAALFLVPVASVLFSLTRSGDGTWSHLVSTVLPEYLFNTAILVAGVAVGVPVIGAGTAWLVTMCRFPGRRVRCRRCCAR